MSRIDIPDMKDTRQRAGQIVIDAIREAGLDPQACSSNPMAVAIIGAWGRGEFDRDAVIRSFRNLGIMNPALKSDAKAATTGEKD